RVALLHAHSPAAVLEIVEPLGLHESIANSTKVEPTVTELVNEQRARVEVFDSVLLSPFECLLPCVVALRRQCKGGRAKSQHVHQKRFIVSLVSIADESVLWGAAMGDRDIFNGL